MVTIGVGPFSPTQILEYGVIGAGPAGLQLGYFLESSGQNYEIFEASSAPGSFFARFPRHSTLISVNKPHTGCSDPETNLRWDWHSLLSDQAQRLFTSYSRSYFPDRSEYLVYLADFARHWRLKIRYDQRIARVSKENGIFLLTTEDGLVHYCRRLIVATGFVRPYIPAIQGIELTENYADASLDPERFRNKRVMIVGKGNSGFETANALIESAAMIHIASPSPLKMAWKTHYVGNLRAVNNNFLDTYQLKSQNAVLDVNIERIEKRGDGLSVSVEFVHAPGERQEIYYDHVIVCAGFRFDDSIFDDSCRPELAPNGRHPAQKSNWESVNVDTLYFAGTLTHARDYKKSTSGFIHGFRYNVRALARMFDQAHRGLPWPSTPVAPGDCARFIIHRVNRTSALWQQFGFLCDVLDVTDEESPRYYEELPLDYVLEGGLAGVDRLFAVTLEYGEHHADFDPFNLDRIKQTDSDKAHLGSYLHPVIRRYSGGSLISTHHIVENLENQWDSDVHVKPLETYLNANMLLQTAASQ